MTRNPDTSHTPNPSEVEDDWLEGVEQEVALVEGQEGTQPLQDLRKSTELRIATLNDSQIDKRLAKLESQLKPLMAERDLRFKASSGKDEALSALNEQIKSLAVSANVMRKELKARETKADRIASVEDLVTPTVEAGPDMDEDEEQDQERIRLMLEAVQKEGEAKLEKAKAEHKAKQEEARAKALLEAEDPDIKADRERIARLEAELPAKLEREHQRQLQREIDQLSLKQEHPAWSQPVEAQASAEVEFQPTAKKPEVKPLATDAYAVQSARVKPESFWGRAKRTLFGGSVKPKEDAYSRNEAIVTAQANAKRAEYNAEHPSLLGRLWNKVTGRTTAQERQQRSAPYAEASRKAEEAYRSLNRQPSTEYPSYSAKKEYGRSRLNEASLRVGKKKIAEAYELPDDAIEPLDNEESKAS